MPGGLTPPLSVVLSWPTPNYDDPQTRGWGVPILAMVLLVLCYLVVGLRLWTRLIMAKNSGWDDALILFNMIPLTAEAICVVLAFKRCGFDHHVWDLTPSMVVQSRQITVALEATYLWSTTTTKISILLFYRRLGAGLISKKFLYTVYAAITFTTVYFIIFFINLFIGCQPFNAFWNRVSIPWLAENEGKWTCFDEAKNMIACACISVIQDFMVCLLPTVLFWKLNIGIKQKVGLGAIFGVGFFLCICGVLRITSTVPIYYSTYDMTWESHDAWVWFVIESHMAIIVASAPALNHFFRRSNVKTYVMSYLGRSSGGGSRSTAVRISSLNGSKSHDIEELASRRKSGDCLDGLPLHSGDITQHNTPDRNRSQKPEDDKQPGSNASWLRDISESDTDHSNEEVIYHKA